MARLLHVYEKLERKRCFFVTRVMEDTFVGGKQRFVVSDDMTIKPASTSSMQSLPQAFHSDGISHRFQEVEQLVDWEQVLSMLKDSLSSVTVLTDAFLSKETKNHNAARAKVKPMVNHNTLPPDQDFATTSPEIKIKIFFNTREKKVKYAECDQEFVDLLLGFMTYPISCVIKITGAGTCHLGRSFRNLYSSVIDLYEAGILKDDITTKLLDSGIMPFDLVSNMASCQPLNCPFPKRDLQDCCWHPELVEGGKYVVEDDLRIHQASAMSVMKHWCGTDKASVLDMDITVRRQEAVALLRALLTSKTALTDAFTSRLEKGFLV
ncbi:uncharacterized protein [Lolium perenne]|uniref:uncharacterized protein n=1 Tax=Lolium perenne TaxID=4522 RepID=UPI003A99B8E8